MEALKAFFRALLNIFKSPEAISELEKLAAPDDGRELPGPDETQQVVLAVIVGHTKADGGAVMFGTKEQEYSYNTRTAKMMTDLAKEHYPFIKVHTIFRDGVGIAGAYAKADKLKADLAIELHFNAANKTAVGTETLCTSAPNDVEFAHIVQKQMCGVFGRTGNSRGVKVIARSARGGSNVHSFPNGANCLVEPFFGDTASEAALANSKQRQYADSLLKAVELYARKADMIK